MQTVLDKHAVVYEHLSNLYEHFWLEIFGKLEGWMRVMIFQEAFSELVAMAQDGNLDSYYERIMRKAV